MSVKFLHVCRFFVHKFIFISLEVVFCDVIHYGDALYFIGNKFNKRSLRFNHCKLARIQSMRVTQNE